MTAIADAPAGSTLQYNGFTFGPFIRCTLHAAPEYDPAHRTVIYHRYTLRTISWHYATDSDQLSTSMEDLRERLLQSGGKLVIEDMGWGDIDTKGNAPDIVFGPHPLHAKFTPLGGSIMWQLDWAVEFKINPCASRGAVAQTAGKPFVIFNYDAAYSNDAMGFTTRVLTCIVQIPQDGSTYTVSDTPENYRNKVRIEVPKGYHRIHKDERVNSSQNQLRLTVVDQQLPTEAPPAGIATADIRFTVVSQDALTNVDINFSVSGQMETIPGFPKSLAQLKFFEIVFSRLLVLRQAIRGTILPLQIAMSHSPFDRRSTFNMSFAVTGARPDDIFKPAVLYSPLPDSNWQTWADSKWGNHSLRNLWENGGQTDLRTVPVDIVDLCNPTLVVQLQSTAGTHPLGSDDQADLPSAYFACPHVDPKYSWLAYEPLVQLIRNNRLSVNKRDVYLTDADTNGQGPLSSMASDTYTGVGSPYAEVGDSVTRAGAPEQLLVFKGKAIRVKYPVTVPRLQAIEGVQLDLMAHKEEFTPGPAVYGCATSYCRWIQVYRPRSYLAGTVLTMPHPQIELLKE